MISALASTVTVCVRITSGCGPALEFRLQRFGPKAPRKRTRAPKFHPVSARLQQAESVASGFSRGGHRFGHCRCRAVTTAPGIALFEESVTVPVKAPVPAVWADTKGAHSSPARIPRASHGLAFISSFTGKYIDLLLCQLTAHMRDDRFLTQGLGCIKVTIREVKTEIPV
jgi:hypothetical protein